MDEFHEKHSEEEKLREDNSQSESDPDNTLKEGLPDRP